MHLVRKQGTFTENSPSSSLPFQRPLTAESLSTHFHTLLFPKEVSLSTMGNYTFMAALILRGLDHHSNQARISHTDTHTPK